MKALLISIRPQLVVFILNFIKKDEIRKGTAIGKAITRLIKEQGVAPMFIYCTKEKVTRKEDRLIRCRNIWFNKGHALNRQYLMNGKVVARFSATAEEIKRSDSGYYYCDSRVVPYGLQKLSCLTQKEIDNYLQGKKGTAIHIDGLVIFDKPREISEFKVWQDCGKCWHEEDCDCDTKYCFFTKPLTKAPQSWCYVEDSL